MVRPRAINKLRGASHYQREAFDDGLRAAGYEMVASVEAVRPGDALLCWSRKSIWGALADEFEAGGGIVFVAENAYLPASMIGPGWYALAEGQHLGAGRWPKGSGDRWDALGVKLQPWREGGTETLILDQNGGGSLAVRSPKHWSVEVQARIGGRIRWHPWKVMIGKVPAQPPIEQDLANAKQAVTWNSSAALTALVMGVPVFNEFPHWIGSFASRPFSEFGQEPKRDDAARLAMFRRLAWAMWRVSEIKTGKPFTELARLKR